jgi:NAD+ synthase (glutamine-hydrolysing)
VCFVGSPVSHQGKLYNCSLVLFNGKIVGIRTKMNLAENDGYCEARWFGKWEYPKQVSLFKLPPFI